MRHRLLASLVLATSLAACSDRAPQIVTVPATADDVRPRPGAMTVTGSATLEVSPDCADITMTILANGARPGIATSEVQAKQQAIVAALGTLGVAPADVKLSFMTLNPIYELDKLGMQTLRVQTYRAEITLTATTKDFAKIGGIIEAGANTGVSSLSTQFRRSDLPELKKKVRDMALAAAKDKAAQTAKALGIRLGRITNVGENVGGYMWSNQYFPQAANRFDTQPSGDGVTLGGALQPLTLDVTIGYELATET